MNLCMVIDGDTLVLFGSEEEVLAKYNILRNRFNDFGLDGSRLALIYLDSIGLTDKEIKLLYEYILNHTGNGFLSTFRMMYLGNDIRGIKNILYKLGLLLN